LYSSRISAQNINFNRHTLRSGLYWQGD